MEGYVKIGEASKKLGVSHRTLMRWADSGQIDAKRTPGGHRIFNVVPKKPEGDKIVYIRVSSRKQRDDLQKQKSFMVRKYPNHKIIEDIASGLNFKRKGLITILEKARSGGVQEVVVASKDRLCRFGFDLIEWLFRTYNVKLVVLNRVDKTPTEEFTEDILAIMQVFSAKWNGQRRYSGKPKNVQNKAKTNKTSEKNIKGLE